MGKGLRNETILNYFNIVIYEFEKGMSIQDISILLKEYESKELYLECEGIKQALEYIKFALLTQIVKEYNFHDFNIKIESYENETNSTSS